MEENVEKRCSSGNHLIASDINHIFQYQGFCKIEINKMGSYLAVRPFNEEFKQISAMFKWRFIAKKNILFVFAEYDFQDFMIVFKNETVCEKVYNLIYGNRPKDVVTNEEIFKRILTPLFNEIIKNEFSFNTVIRLLSKWMKKLEKNDKEFYTTKMKENEIYHLIFPNIESTSLLRFPAMDVFAGEDVHEQMFENRREQNDDIEVPQDEEETYIVPVMLSARVRTFSQTSLFSTTSTASAIKRKKREFEKDEELDAAKFTMADLIDWRPKTENTLRSKWKEAEKKFKEEGFTVKRDKKEEEAVGAAEIGPKVKMDEDGNVIIDEESLVVRRNPRNSVLETVDNDLMPKNLNSLSFKKNYSRTTNWSAIETELFYDILSSTGTDFSLMQEYLPFKTRADLKKKFKKEEKVNMNRINATLSKPSILNDKLIKRRVEKYIDLIDKQEEEKLAAKMKKKKKTTESPTNSNPEVIEETDATQKSETVEPETSEPKKKRFPKAKAEKQNKPKKAPKKKSKKESTPIVTSSASEESVIAPAGHVTPPRRENEEAAAALLTRPRNTRFGGLFEELGNDFPYFDIEEDDKIQVPLLKKMPEQSVILRIPTTTQLKVMQKTKKSIYNRIGITTPTNTKYFVGISTDSENTKSLVLHKL